MSKHGQRLYDFGPFRLDTESHALLRDGRPVTLTRKAVEMLIVLVESRGEVLEKEELLKRLWPDTTVEESNLTQNVYMIRQALGEAAHQQAYIETVPKRGYRFVAEVTEVSTNGHHPPANGTDPERTHAPAGQATLDASALAGVANAEASGAEVSAGGAGASAPPGVEPVAPPAPLAAAAIATAEATPAADDAAPASSPHVGAAPAASATARAASPVPPRRSKVNTILLVALVVALGLGAAAAYVWKARGLWPNRGARVIAVLPLKHIGPEAEAEHLGLGMADAMITKLSNLQQISVRPTSAIFKYTAAADYDPVRAGRELGVDAVVEGSVQRAGDSVRVTVRLLSIPDGQPLWGEIYNRKATDVFAVQDSISEEVAQALKVKLTSAEKSQITKHHTQNPEAYQAYARGFYFWNLRTEEGFRQSIRHYEEAIALDPSYALAHAGLADSYGLVAYYSYERVVPRAEALNRAREMAARAVRLDDTLAEAHAATGLVRSLAGDVEGAAEGYKRSIQLNPSYATARQRYALTLLNDGRLEEAAAEMHRAQALDPLSAVININLAQMYYFARDYERAATLCQKALETTPGGINQLLLINLLGNTRAQQGRHDEARELFRRALEQDNEFDEAREGLAYTAALAGRRDEAMEFVPRFRGLTGQYPQAHLSLALTHAALGESDEAFTHLDAYAGRQTSPPSTLRYDPRLDRLRADPRYQEIFKRRFGR